MYTRTRPSLIAESQLRASSRATVGGASTSSASTDSSLYASRWQPRRSVIVFGKKPSKPKSKRQNWPSGRGFSGTENDTKPTVPSRSSNPFDESPDYLKRLEKAGVAKRRPLWEEITRLQQLDQEPAQNPSQQRPASPSLAIQDELPDRRAATDELADSDLDDEDEDFEEGALGSAPSSRGQPSAEFGAGDDPLGPLDRPQPGDPPCVVYLTTILQCADAGGRLFLDAERVLSLYEQDIQTPAMGNAVTIARFLRALAAVVEPLPGPAKSDYHTLYLRAAETLLSIKLTPKSQFLVSLPLIASTAMGLPWNLDEILQRKTEAAVLRWGWLYTSVAVNILFHYGKLSQPIPHELLGVIMASIEYSIKKQGGQRRMHEGAMLKVLTSLCRILAVSEARRALVLFEPLLEEAYRAGRLIASSEPRITLTYRIVDRPEPAWLMDFRFVRKALFRGSAEGDELSAAQAPGGFSPSSIAAGWGGVREGGAASADRSDIVGAVSEEFLSSGSSDGEWMSELADTYRAFEAEEDGFDDMMNEVQGSGSGTGEDLSKQRMSSSSSLRHDSAQEAFREKSAERSVDEARYRASTIDAIKSAPTGRELLRVFEQIRAEGKDRPGDAYGQQTELQILVYFLQRAGELAAELQSSRQLYHPAPVAGGPLQVDSTSDSSSSQGRSSSGGSLAEGQSLRLQDAAKRFGPSRTGIDKRKPAAGPGPSTAQQDSADTSLLRDIQQAFLAASFELLSRDQDSHLMKKQTYGVKPCEHAFYMGLSPEDLAALEAKFAEWLSLQRVLPETAYRALNAYQRLQLRPRGSALISLMQALSLADSRPELLDVDKRATVLYALSQLAMAEEFNRCCIWFLPMIVEAARATRGFPHQPSLRNKLEKAFINMGLPKPSWLTRAPSPAAKAPASPEPNASKPATASTAAPAAPPPPAAPLTPLEKRAQKLARRAAQAALTSAGKTKEQEPFKLPVPMSQLFMDEPLSSSGEQSELIFAAIARDPDRFADHVEPRKLVRFLLMVSKRGLLQTVPKTVGFGVMKGPFAGAVLYNSLAFITFFEGWRPVLKRHLTANKLDASDLETLWRAFKEARFNPDVDIVRWLDVRTVDAVRAMTDEELASVTWSVAILNMKLSDQFATRVVEQLRSRMVRLSAAHACRAFYALAMYAECTHGDKRAKAWNFTLESRTDVVELFEAFARRIGELPDWDFALDERTNGQVVSGVRLLRTSTNPRLCKVPDLIPAARLDAFMGRFRALVEAGRDPQRVSRLQDKGTNAMRQCLELYYKYYMLQVDAMFRAQFGSLIKSRDDYPLELTPEQIFVERVTDDGLHSIDLTIENPLTGNKTAVEIDGPMHHTYSLDLNAKGIQMRLSGKTMARQRLLYASGWEVSVLTRDDLDVIIKDLEASAQRLRDDPDLEARLVEKASVNFPIDELKKQAEIVTKAGGDLGDLIGTFVADYMDELEAKELASSVDANAVDAAFMGLVPSSYSIRVLRRFVIQIGTYSEILINGDRFPALIFGELILAKRVLPKPAYDYLWLIVTSTATNTKILRDPMFLPDVPFVFSEELNAPPSEVITYMWEEVWRVIREAKLIAYGKLRTNVKSGAAAAQDADEADPYDSLGLENLGILTREGARDGMIMNLKIEIAEAELTTGIRTLFVSHGAFGQSDPEIKLGNDAIAKLERARLQLKLLEDDREKHGLKPLRLLQSTREGIQSVRRRHLQDVEEFYSAMVVASQQGEPIEQGFLDALAAEIQRVNDLINSESESGVL